MTACLSTVLQSQSLSRLYAGSVLVSISFYVPGMDGYGRVFVHTTHSILHLDLHHPHATDLKSVMTEPDCLDLT
jgi:hypothetical protein